MATKAFRDRRLTDGAKACLGIIRARCGRGVITHTTKTTLASIMGRSTRTIQRYIVDLIRFGYIKTKTRTKRSGWHIGLSVQITKLTLPFFADTPRLAEWLMKDERFQTIGETKLSPKNDSSNILSLFPKIEHQREWKYAGF